MAKGCNLIKFTFTAFTNEDDAIAMLERMRWPNGVCCPRCGGADPYRLTPKAETKTRTQRGLWKCSQCRQKFTVKVGTIFESSHIPVSKWLMALHLISASKMRTLSQQYPRYGYRKIRIFLARQGHAMSPERTYRLWRQAGLQVPKRRPRRRVATGRPRPLAPTAANHVWAYDFVFDTCADHRSLKCLTVVDEFTRECLAIDVGGSIRSGRVIDVLSQLVSVHGAPQYLRSDNGPEFVALALFRWVQTVGIDPTFIDPGEPWQNGTDESFNGKFRDECLNLEWFRNRLEAKVGIERWRRHYNEERPHMSLGDLTPAEFKDKIKSQSGCLTESPVSAVLQ